MASAPRAGGSAHRTVADDGEAADHAPSQAERLGAFWRRVASPLPASWRAVLFASPALVSENVEGIIWRKHWVVLVWRAWIPFLVLLGLLIALPFLGEAGQALGLEGAALALPWLVASCLRLVGCGGGSRTTATTSMWLRTKRLSTLSASRWGWTTSAGRATWNGFSRSTRARGRVSGSAQLRHRRHPYGGR